MDGNPVAHLFKDWPLKEQPTMNTKFLKLIPFLIALSLLVACDYDGDGKDDGFLPDFGRAFVSQATAEPGAPTTKSDVTDYQTGWDTEWYRSPFMATTDSLNDTATLETFAEPGVLLDDTAAFDYLSASETPVLVPEGGFSYIATGAVTISYDGSNLELRHQDRNIYLVILRGLPADGTDWDPNQIVLTSAYVRATGIYSPMPAGAYVSLGWFEQQIKNAYGDPNCGREGCKQITIVVVDLETHTYRQWVTKNPIDLRDWTRVQ